ncbi:TetR family transcriptional regulator [Streptomyces sp. INA 01156]
MAERGLETKYRIAETAMALFLEQGYESVTVEAVADASQVSRRTVFRYFDGKDELAFPDHSARLELLARHLVKPTGGGPGGRRRRGHRGGDARLPEQARTGAPALPADPGRARVAQA